MKTPLLIALGISLIFTCASLAADSAPTAKPLVVELWPGKVPGDIGIAGEEKFIDVKVNGKSHTVGGKPVLWLTNVTRPSITFYPAPRETNTGAAMLICPGGGYHNLEWDCEGTEVAAWLNSIGINGVLLKYRCPRRAGEVKTEPAVGPIIDAQRAVSMVRSRAGEWGIDPNKVGMIGFSAGGHLVGATATQFNHR
ncbi:MAG TPA: alpha/beta hydrolase, partial [Tepidisphaeraceae bacterium]|nr:alpha/beta hydrolase [Tepidisphaeraceae bacterium]